MYISTEDMKSCIQEWFAQALGFDDLREIYNAVRSEADKQFEYMADSIAKQRAEDGMYEDNN
jgi:hypothetical protein